MVGKTQTTKAIWLDQRKGGMFQGLPRLKYPWVLPTISGPAGQEEWRGPWWRANFPDQPVWQPCLLSAFPLGPFTPHCISLPGGTVLGLSFPCHFSETESHVVRADRTPDLPASSSQTLEFQVFHQESQTVIPFCDLLSCFVGFKRNSHYSLYT